MDAAALTRWILACGAVLLGAAVLLATCSAGCGGGEIVVVGECPDASADAGPCEADGGEP